MDRLERIFCHLRMLADSRQGVAVVLASTTLILAITLLLVTVKH